MPTRRLADRQIRAAQQAALRLDVRGPVSEALGKAGVIVPEEPEAASRTGAAEPTTGGAAPPVARTSGLRAPAPAVKPFQRAAWPTRRTRAEPAPEPPPLSGLTADERRVHRILLDALARENAQDGVSSGLSYAEKKHLPTLDLAFIDAQLERLEQQRASQKNWATAGIAIGVTLVPLVVLAVAVGGADAGALFGVLLGVFALGGALLVRAGRMGGPGPRQQIYEALRELALLVDDAPVSDAVRQADLLIDRLAGADAPDASASRPAPRARTHS